jgi:hypothetical protein
MRLSTQTAEYALDYSSIRRVIVVVRLTIHSIANIPHSFTCRPTTSPNQTPPTETTNPEVIENDGFEKGVSSSWSPRRVLLIEL